MKKCSKCKIEKEEKLFSKDNKRKDKLQVVCRVCQSLYKAEYYKNNKIRCNRRSTKHYEDNRETLNLHRKKYRIEHKDLLKKQVHRCYVKRKASIIEKNRERRKTDIAYRIKCNLRNRQYRAIKGKQKVGSAVRDLGCSINFLKGYLEVQFYDNPETGEKMTWNNYGFYGWHIDHDTPLSSFDLTDREQFLKACHFSNLQPLWWFENLSKGDKLSAQS